MEGGFLHKVALVTGAASGIGAATAKALSAQGADLVLADRDPVGLAAMVDATGDAGRIRPVVVDLLEPGSAEACVQAAVDEFGGLDLLVTCAGVIYQHDAVATTDEEWDVMIGTNLTAVFRCCRAAIPPMRMRGGGAIVNIGSGWGLLAGAETVSYAVCKAGVLNLTRALAIDHGPEGIRVNAVCPSLIDTPMLRGNFQDRGVPDYQEALTQAGLARPLRRWGTAEEVASVICWLLSDGASYVTGGYVAVDGGSLAEGG